MAEKGCKMNERKQKAEKYNDVLKQYHSIYPSEDFPDIILIVNESWYDMTQIPISEKTYVPVDGLNGMCYTSVKDMELFYQ